MIEYVEAYMEVLTALGDAENDLYSANFADYSGGGGTKVSRLGDTFFMHVLPSVTGVDAMGSIVQLVSTASAGPTNDAGTLCYPVASTPEQHGQFRSACLVRTPVFPAVEC